MLRKNMKAKTKTTTIVLAIIISLSLALLNAQEQVKPAEKKVDLGSYTDKKLDEAFKTLADTNKTSSILILNTNGTLGKGTFFHKLIYDKDQNHLILLKRAIYDNKLGPMTSYSWVIWRGVEDADLSDGVPWFSERLRSEMSKPTEDGRKTLPVKYPMNESITAWP